MLQLDWLAIRSSTAWAARLRLGYGALAPAFALTKIERRLERVKGIEPSWPAWKAGTLPLSYTRALGASKLPRPVASAK